MLVTDPSLLIGPYLRHEALASYRIEGTQVSLSDVFQADAVKRNRPASVARSRRLISIRESYHSEAIKERSSLPQLVDIIVRNPLVTVKSVQTESRSGPTGHRPKSTNTLATHKDGPTSYEQLSFWIARTTPCGPVRAAPA